MTASCWHLFLLAKEVNRILSSCASFTLVGHNPFILLFTLINVNQKTPVGIILIYLFLCSASCYTYWPLYFDVNGLGFSGS